MKATPVIAFAIALFNTTVLGDVKPDHSGIPSDFRVTIEPNPENALRLTSQVMADKPVTIRRERIGQRIGRLGNQDMARLGIALAFVLGLAD